jgi:hypothetical protein
MAGRLARLAVKERKPKMSEKRVLSDEKEKELDILESNFKECLNHLHKYITFILVLSIIYLAILTTPQPVEVPGLPIKLEGGFALAILGAFYVAIGGMATYVAERANNIANLLVESKLGRFKALRLSPSIGTSDVPIVRFIVSFLPPSIFSAHLGYLGYKASNGGVAIPIILYVSVGITLWTLLPVGKKAVERHSGNKNGS